MFLFPVGKKDYLSFPDNSAHYSVPMWWLAAKLHKSHNPTSAKIIGCTHKWQTDGTQYIHVTPEGENNKHAGNAHTAFACCLTQKACVVPFTIKAIHGRHSKAELEAFCEKALNSWKRIPAVEQCGHVRQSYSSLCLRKETVHNLVHCATITNSFYQGESRWLRAIIWTKHSQLRSHQPRRVFIQRNM